MEEKEEAGYRSSTWSILRALQKINQVKRLEDEAPCLLSGAGMRTPKVLGRGWRTYPCGMGKFIGIEVGAVVEKYEQVERLSGLLQVEEKRRRATPVWSRWKTNFLKLQQASQTQSRRED